MFCTICGKQFEGNAEFCTHCGTRIDLTSPTKRVFDRMLGLVLEKPEEKRRNPTLVGSVGRGKAAILCVRCGAGVVDKASASQYTCSACGLEVFIARCPSCSIPVHIHKELWGRKVTCLTCGRSSGWGRWNAPVTLGQLAAAFDVDQIAVADSSRRVVSGVVIGGSGYPIAARVGCRLEFAPDKVYIYKLVAGNKGETVATVEYVEVVSLQVGGPGVITTGGGWVGGGFGAEGIIMGVIFADVMNKMTTSSRIETIIQFSTTTGVLVIFNNLYMPEELSIILSPIVNRIVNSQRKPTTPSVNSVEQLQKLAQLRADGTITEDEFQRLKAAIIGPATS